MNTSQNASGVPHAAPLQVSTAPRPSDIRLSVQVAPGAPLGTCEVVLGLGRGSKGKGTRPGDDHALHVAAVRRLAEDLAAYSNDYERAALAEDPAGWWERLAVAADSVRPGRTTLCPCGEPTTSTEYCAKRHPVLADRPAPQNTMDVHSILGQVSPPRTQKILASVRVF